MSTHKVKIGVVAPAARLDRETAVSVERLAEAEFPHRIELVFHPQCFLSSGHFAGNDAARTKALLEFANDASFSAIWFARGGYGSGRIAESVLSGLGESAKQKVFLGYSDGAFLLGGLYRHGFHAAHGPIPYDIRRNGGNEAITRALSFLLNRTSDTLERSVDGKHPTAAFNITILSHMIGTELLPDLSGHVVMLEEVSEHLYAIDRAMFHITSAASIRRAAGIRLGRCSDVPPNDPDFGQTPEQIVQHWCERSGIPYLGRADIGHDASNKIIPFGLWQGLPR